ncbi:MAG: TlpA family protein disulfide reductase [Desulfosarcina sp.]|nr:TlpA family protein disulfide reductase [Desulfosarcina sp.]MBC2743731.1 TlpA family protein disulfide reductase [Desulfosarcina sp.]MBC2766640.1 TlpA family protein disulfide reductase [Desulfosarcina sp.]
MKTLCLWWMVALVMLAAPGMASEGKVPATGDLLVGMRMDSPEDPDKRAYLGLEDRGNFDPTDITGRLLVIEIFSMYCPHCQREAPVVNRLYQAIEASKALRGQVKMIGIGVGNSTYEVDHFRKHYKIEFPLFPDEDFVIHKSLGEVRTPFFIISTIGSDNKGKILWTGAGNMEPLETFMDRLNGFLKKR